MITKYKIGLAVVLCAYMLPFLSGCSSSILSTPKGVVMAMFGAMQKDDKATLAHLLDLPILMKNINEDYALQSDSPRVFTSPQQILEDLTDGGLTKTRWFSYQRVINKTEVSGETAIVEVTFVDKQNSKGYRTNFGLHKVNGKWKIYSFKSL
ncbi:MAG: hypothetical protein GXO93_06045 [FCB group bacterium]|nr:hypothetical protein [FCB group bacterium]